MERSRRTYTLLRRSSSLERRTTCRRLAGILLLVLSLATLIVVDLKPDAVVQQQRSGMLQVPSDFSHSSGDDGMEVVKQSKKQMLWGGALSKFSTALAAAMMATTVSHRPARALNRWQSDSDDEDGLQDIHAGLPVLPQRTSFVPYPTVSEAVEGGGNIATSERVHRLTPNLWRYSKDFPIKDDDGGSELRDRGAERETARMPALDANPGYYTKHFSIDDEWKCGLREEDLEEGLEEGLKKGNMLGIPGATDQIMLSLKGRNIGNISVWINNVALTKSSSASSRLQQQQQHLGVEFLITKYAKLDSINNITFKIHDEGERSKRNFIEDIFLTLRPAAFLLDFHVKADIASAQNVGVTQGLISVEAHVAYPDGPPILKDVGVHVSCIDERELDAEGRICKVMEQGHPISHLKRGKGYVINHKAAIFRPKRYSCEVPYLYTVLVSLVNSFGANMETITFPIGFRTIDLRGGQLTLNKASLRLFGTYAKSAHKLAAEAAMRKREISNENEDTALVSQLETSLKISDQRGGPSSAPASNLTSSSYPDMIPSSSSSPLSSSLHYEREEVHRELEKYLQYIKGDDFNAVLARPEECPEEMYRLCTDLGIYVIDMVELDDLQHADVEAILQRFTQVHLRNRNHPCVVGMCVKLPKNAPQCLHQLIYSHLKSLDDERFVVSLLPPPPLPTEAKKRGHLDFYELGAIMARGGRGGAADRPTAHFSYENKTYPGDIAMLEGVPAALSSPYAVPAMYSEICLSAWKSGLKMVGSFSRIMNTSELAKSSSSSSSSLSSSSPSMLHRRVLSCINIQVADVSNGRVTLEICNRNFFKRLDIYNVYYQILENDSPIPPPLDPSLNRRDSSDAQSASLSSLSSLLSSEHLFPPLVLSKLRIKPRQCEKVTLDAVPILFRPIPGAKYHINITIVLNRDGLVLPRGAVYRKFKLPLILKNNIR